MSTKSLKETYRWHLRSFVAFNAMVFLAFFAGEDILSAIRSLQFLALATPNTALALALPLATLLLEGIVPAQWKAVLVYWRVNDPLPGTAAFTKHGRRDTRVDMKALERKYGPLPDDPAEQNQLWYKILKVVEDRPSVADAHRSFLLPRDLVGISFLLVPIGATVGAVHRLGVALWGTGVAVLVLQYLGLKLVAATKGNRFVTTVLAEATASAD